MCITKTWQTLRDGSLINISSTIRDVLNRLPIMNMCQPVTRNLQRRHLRSAVRGDLIVPPTRTVRYGPRSFAVAGPSTWNALPAPLCNDELSAVSFRRQLKTELYIGAYYSHWHARDCFHGKSGEHNFNVINNKLCGRPPQYAPAPYKLTFLPWRWCPSHVWRGLPRCQF